MTSKNENDVLRGKRYIRLVRCSTKGQADTSISDQLALLKNRIFGAAGEASAA